MPYYCTVPRCTSMAGKAKNVSFHQFPRDEELAKLWNKILKRGKPYTKYSKVCSLHFRPEDYTITSVGKNRGQWRTLRKDAIPSQNLPLDIPPPYHRSTRNTGSWAQSSMPQNLLDPQIHQQMAQAIYMQTMLAMQAQVGATEPLVALRNDTETPTDLTPHTSTDEDQKTPTDPQRTSYKCTECSRCFKDPDVFKLHQRIHTKTCEKENLNRNGENLNKNLSNENLNREETLRSNPILANLLKGGNNLDSFVGIESHIMASLAVNMENYFKNMMLNQCKTECENQGDSCDVQESRDSCDVQESRDSCDVQESRDSCDVQESRDSSVERETDSCEKDSDSENRDLEDSIDSNVLIIDEDAQKDL